MRLIDADALIAEMSKHSGPVTNNEWLNAVCNAHTIKPTITLDDLLDLIDYNRESTAERIQIVGPDDDWDTYDEVRTSSTILFHLGSAKVSEIEAVGNDVIRVGIDWSTAPLPSKENQP